MAKNESKKLAFTLFLISLSLHLFVFVASSHEYVWNKPVKTSRPLKFRVVSVEKPKEKLPPNPQSRFLSNANRKESGSGNPSEIPRLRRESKDQIPARRGGLGPKTVSLSPASESRVPAPSVPPARPSNSPAVAAPKPEPEKAEKSKERKPPETSKTTETPRPTETASLAPTPKPSVKPPSPAIQEKVQPKAKPPVDKKPERKKIEAKAIPKIKRKPKPAVRKKTKKKIVKKKPQKESKKAEAKKQTKEKVELAALKPVPRPVRPRRPISKRPQPKDPLALFRVKPQSKVKPKLPKFDLSDEVADRIAKRSLSDKELEKEGGETISLDTRDFRYASYFAHIKRRIQNAWIWPAEAQKNRGELLLRFKLRKNGTLEEVRLIKSAGVRILDDLAMAAVTKAAPFEPFPEGLERKSITATFVYE